jgi:hypothetical protein
MLLVKTLGIINRELRVRIESKQSLCHVDTSVTTPSHAAPPAHSWPAVPLAGPAACGAEMCMRRRVTPAARARPVDPVTAGCAASYSAVQLLRGRRNVALPVVTTGKTVV